MCISSLPANPTATQSAQIRNHVATVSYRGALTTFLRAISSYLLIKYLLPKVGGYHRIRREKTTLN
jgi:hypothetical protein